MTALEELLASEKKKAPARTISSDTMDSIQALRRKGPKRRGRRTKPASGGAKKDLDSFVEEMNESVRSEKMDDPEALCEETIDSRQLLAEAKPRLLKRSGRRPSRMVRDGNFADASSDDDKDDDEEGSSSHNDDDKLGDFNESTSSMGRHKVKRGGRRPSRMNLTVNEEGSAELTAD